MKQLSEACSGLLPYGVIEAAVEGDPEALICVVEHYYSFTNVRELALTRMVIVYTALILNIGEM